MCVRLAWMPFLLAFVACGEDAEIPLLAPGAETGAAGSGGNGQLDSGADGSSSDAAVDQCSSSANCEGTEKFCNTELGRCVECLVSSQCDVGKGCAPNGACEDACGTDVDCTSGDKPFCLPGSLVCVECEGDSDCDELERPFCEPSTKKCVECLVSGHCEADQTCDPADFQCGG